MTACGITILHAPGCVLAKTIRPGGEVAGYEGARWFNLHAEPVADLDALAQLLRTLAPHRDCAVVRGAVADPERVASVRRLVHADAATGEAATLVEAPRRWVALDVDGIDLPEGIDLRDLTACARAVRPKLPREFREVRCIVQATGSHGVKPGARLRLWYWLSRPTSGRELKEWLRGVPGIDAAVFGPAQLIYTAAPRLALGVSDPVPERLAVLPGAEVVKVPPPLALAPPPRVVSPYARPEGKAPSDRYVAAALARATAAITAAPEGSRHETAKRESWSLSRLLGTGALSQSTLHSAIAAAVVAAGKPQREGERIAEWCFRNRGAGA